MRIWRTLRPVDHAFIQGIIGDMVMFAETLLDWIFLRTAAEFWDPEHAVFNFQGTELAPTIEEYTALIQRPTPTTHGIFVPNPFTTVQSQLSTLLHIPARDIHEELHQSAMLVMDSCSWSLALSCSPYSPNLIDGAIAQVVLQAVGGHSYVEALLAETVRSLDYVRERSFIERLAPAIPPPEHSFSEWRRFWRELTPARFLWVARWNPGGPMITGCPGIVGVPLLSHLGSTLIFPDRNGGRRSSRHLRGSQPAGSGSFSTASNACSTASNSCRHALGILERPSYAPPAPGVFRSTPCTGLTDVLRLRRPSPHRGTRGHELLALLRGPNRASSSSTPPPGQGPTVDPAPGITPTQAPENMDAPAPSTLHTSMAQPFTSPYPPPPAPTAVPLPSATFLSSEQVLPAPPPVSIPGPAMAYTAPPQPHAGFSYQAPPPINTTFHEPGTPTHAAQFASPTHFFPEADAEQERRLKRMEETIWALQAGDARPDARYGDCSLFPGMRLPPKFKVPKFKTYEGTTDPRHHLPHYRGKMLQYWKYEEFVIHSFQDSLSGSALDWFMPLKAEDIPTWEDPSRKFTNQYRYCAETLPTLLELSTKEMARGQRFEEYAAKWRAQAAKHIPPISEEQQIQLFHSTLRGVYYSHLSAHTSSFSDLIEAGKKLDLGIKLRRMEDPTNKGEESSKKAPAALSRSTIRPHRSHRRRPHNHTTTLRPPPLSPLNPGPRCRELLHRRNRALLRR
ncbi:hypothetical protein CRG98_043042, partial [Punica granatum]